MSGIAHLWKNYPDKDWMMAKCRNKQADAEEAFSDYCAILLSECLIRSGANISVYKGNKCWSHSGPKHILLAEDLAKGLSTNPPDFLSKRENVSASSFQSDLNGRSGVIFFKDYWQRGNEKFANRSGDHIDLWHNNKITGGSMLYRSIIELFGFVSDLNNSKTVWFWEAKNN